ncbi:MAG: hypothetical protein ACREFC_12335, partial [Stellaceae bacterium]
MNNEFGDVNRVWDKEWREANMSSQYEVTIDIAGAFRRGEKREGKLPALLYRCRAAAAMMLMIVFAIAPCELRAQERVA